MILHGWEAHLVVALAILVGFLLTAALPPHRRKRRGNHQEYISTARPYDERKLVRH
jgi:hypothetical protein